MWSVEYDMGDQLSESRIYFDKEDDAILCYKVLSLAEGIYVKEPKAISSMTSTIEEWMADYGNEILEKAKFVNTPPVKTPDNDLFDFEFEFDKDAGISS